MEDRTKEYSQMNFTLPHDVVPLPSQGLFYKNKKKSLKVGYLTAQDENILMGGADDSILNLLRNKIYEPDIRVDELLEGDIEAIMIFLRNTSFGTDLTLNLTDPTTKKNFQYVVSLERLSVIEGEKPSDDGTFTVKLPRSGATVKLKPLTYGEVLELDKIANTYPMGRPAPKVTMRLNKQIVEVDGSVDRGEIAKFVEQLPIMDSKFIKKFMSENEPRLDMSRTITTPSGESLIINVGFGVDFFRPFF